MNADLEIDFDASISIKGIYEENVEVLIDGKGQLKFDSSKRAIYLDGELRIYRFDPIEMQNEELLKTEGEFIAGDFK